MNFSAKSEHQSHGLGLLCRFVFLSDPLICPLPLEMLYRMKERDGFFAEWKYLVMRSLVCIVCVFSFSLL
ncbi:transmembrane protein, putative [Bodo saltans]|uniref:Transmembrane protein, putative n=1 Tax=Bodo saltans TaxID=75058 RepID=A0A0S4IPL4_BODSA|nr:transmembrane protein, putative [Bodo saltans]|eukprot:CUF06195.1 transmembrane protein, putative [Bodo saltans]